MPWHNVVGKKKNCFPSRLNTPLPTFISSSTPACPRLPEGRACAVVFDCKFIETSATLQHNVAELFEGVVRQLRLRRQDGSARDSPAPRRRASFGQRARRFLARLTARSARRRALKARSKSCHNLAVL